jgi:hypothetical protein
VIQIRQLCTADTDEGRVRWIETIWCGVRLSTARFWLANMGWGINRCGCGWIACSHAPMRLTMRGRTWIEDINHPATS